MSCLNAFVGATIVVSIITLGISMDVAQNWVGWTVMESLCGAVFLGELAFKVATLGLRQYLWTGENWHWNWLDVFITLFMLVDLVISLIGVVGDAQFSMVKFTLVLRALRLTRIARLVKLLRTPLLAELANMLAGFLIGVPCMLWVLVFMAIIFFSLGMIFRQTLGPEPGADYMLACGSGDGLGDSTEECPLHKLYGEEFFGSVWSSMFTGFRCVLGDCTTKGGQSLTTHLSHGYGFYFDISYCVGMVVVIFGLFNIITAIFVESTISGLKYNDVQRKYARMYESRYVTFKIEALVAQITTIREEGEDFCTVCNERTDYVEEVALSEQDFRKVISDPVVKGILDDLGVHMDDHVAHRLFEMLDGDHDGYVAISDLVDTLLTVRGELSKTDMITNWVSLRSLKEEFTGFKKLMKVVLENQIRIEELLRYEEVSARGESRRTSISPRRTSPRRTSANRRKSLTC